MNHHDLPKELGTLSVDPTGDVIAGGYGTWRLVYTAGRFGMDDDSTLKICWRFASDWGQPQASNPHGENYFTCTTTGPARVEASYQFKGHVRPWFHGILVRVFDGDLAPGDQIILTLGERSGGSPGQRAPTAISKRSEFRAFVDCCGTRQYLSLAEAATLRIVSGPAAKLVLTAPSQAVAGEPFRVHVRLEDEWGNPASGHRGAVVVSGASSSPSTRSLGEKDGGVGWLEGVKLDKPGTCWLHAREERLGLTAMSNPIVCQAAPSGLKPFWGDPHGQSEEAMGLGSVSDYFRFGRDVIALDFGSNQGNDFDVDAEGWKKIRAAAREMNEPGRFVTFLGYEWSGNVAGGGDHNVLYRGDDGPLLHSGHWCVEADGVAPAGKDEGNDRYPIDELYRDFAGREDVMLIPHVGGRHGNFDYHDPRLERLVEIYSSWGLFEWFLEDALRRGLKVGFVGASDDHKGRPGSSPPGAGVFGVRGGLTCVLASEKTREALWDALKARRCYATSGARIVMEFDADGHAMGEEFASAQPRFRCRAIGTAPLERLELRRNRHVIHVVEPLTLTAPTSRFVRVAWSGLRNKARYARQVWDGHVQVRHGRIVSAK
ncbi:MAG: DUF3604 domain-containing protein, partial [Planctomycetes bacterium]|nr:DUF3604 domain-containing protein [Planctomycetota bacterium]